MRYSFDMLARIDATPLVGVLFAIFGVFTVFVLPIQPVSDAWVVDRDWGHGWLDGSALQHTAHCWSASSAELPQEQPRAFYCSFLTTTTWEDVVLEVDACKASAPEVDVAFLQGSHGW